VPATTHDADVTLADGTPVHLREIRPDDADALVAFHEQLSPESIVLRYFGPHPRLSPKEVERLTNVDGVDRFALVAVCDDRIVGVTRYERTPGTDEAEVAFLVADAFQGKRLGTILFEKLTEGARQHGIRRLVADTLAENSRMLGVFRDSGYRRHYDRFSEVVQVALDIAPDDRAPDDIAPDGMASDDGASAADAARRPDDRP
jgi:RimJ/RimL family protein N-acetyltransferase